MKTNTYKVPELYFCLISAYDSSVIAATMASPRKLSRRHLFLYPKNSSNLCKAVVAVYDYFASEIVLSSTVSTTITRNLDIFPVARALVYSQRYQLHSICTPMGYLVSFSANLE